MLVGLAASRMPANSCARAVKLLGGNDFGDQAERMRFGRVDDPAAEQEVARDFSPIWRRRKTETSAGMKPIFTSV